MPRSVGREKGRGKKTKQSAFAVFRLGIDVNLSRFFLQVRALYGRETPTRDSVNRAGEMAFGQILTQHRNISGIPMNSVSSKQAKVEKKTFFTGKARKREMTTCRNTEIPVNLFDVSTLIRHLLTLKFFFFAIEIFTIKWLIMFYEWKDYFVN